jgi:hypothetical protein
MMADGSLLRSGGETWGPVSPDNVQETGVLPGGQRGFPVVAAPPSKSSEVTRQDLKGASIPIGGLTSGFPHQGSLGRGEPLGSVSPDNVHETGASPGGQSGSRIVAADGPAG